MYSKFSISAFLVTIPLVLFLEYGCKKDPESVVDPQNKVPVYENSGLIGSLGGRVQVTDPASSIKGAFAEIPEGVLSQPANISLSQENIKAPTDSSAVVVRFGPEDLTFSKPVKIGIPYNPKTNISDLKAFYYDDVKKKIEELGIDSIDIAKNIIVAHISRFSKIYVGKSDVSMNIDMFMSNGKIAGKLRIFGSVNGSDNGLSGIPTEYSYNLRSGYTNVMQALESNSGYHFSIFTISLFEYESGISYRKATTELCVHKNSNSGANHLISVMKDNNIVYSPVDFYLNNSEKLNLWYSGSTLVYCFDKFVPVAGKEYYVTVNWNMAGDISGSSKSSISYCFSTVKDRKIVSGMPSKNLDTDNNFIDDAYQRTEGNQPPSVPNNPWPPIDGVNWPAIATLSWNCSDPENDPIRYDVYLGTTNPPTTKVSALQSSIKYLTPVLNGGVKYYWQVFAKDDHFNITAGPVWNFTTEMGDRIPDVPTLLAPSNNSENIPVEPSLSWNPSNRALSYWLQVSVSKTFSSTVLSQIGITSTSYKVTGLNENTQYYWRVCAVNNSGPTYWSAAWAFITVPGSMGITPCPGIPTVDYGGKTYNTVQVGSQCWLKENLDVGTMIKGSMDQTNNSVIEKYCYGNDTKNCTKYGGLYQWNEAMKYTVSSAKVQGICPEGWHIPTYDELKTLALSANNDGNALKYVSQGADSGIGTNTSGFSALLAGYRSIDGVFCYLSYSTILMSSSESNALGVNTLYLIDNNKIIGWKGNYKAGGYSIRCIKD